MLEPISIKAEVVIIANVLKTPSFNKQPYDTGGLRGSGNDTFVRDDSTSIACSM